MAEEAAEPAFRVIEIDTSGAGLQHHAGDSLQKAFESWMSVARRLGLAGSTSGLEVLRAARRAELEEKHILLAYSFSRHRPGPDGKPRLSRFSLMLESVRHRPPTPPAADPPAATPVQT